ncbi:hypothetical protein SAMN05216551_107247 [Chitinasiproducens palmae]|uniref:Uncharacterized protein n=1 Tax=Chitinasiproducens palmae TaxID=1770053 RepID=A0A1H2PR28_9BURK|nr:hypothetical protein SAMN05216551_107247 [Chitinasiproducens palmae]
MQGGVLRPDELRQRRDRCGDYHPTLIPLKVTGRAGEAAGRVRVQPLRQPAPFNF